VAPTIARAQLVPVSDETIVNSYTTGAQMSPAVASDGAGNFIVVWSDASSSIRGQRYDAAGARVGTELEAGAGFAPTVAMTADGSFLVAWTEGTPQILARAYDSSGQPRADSFRVDTTIFDYDHGSYHGYEDMKGDPAVAAGTNGNFTVVWAGGYTSTCTSPRPQGHPRTSHRPRWRTVGHGVQRRQERLLLQVRAGRRRQHARGVRRRVERGRGLHVQLQSRHRARSQLRAAYETNRGGRRHGVARGGSRARPDRAQRRERRVRRIRGRVAEQ
jgi:hypothetical protein